MAINFFKIRNGLNVGVLTADPSGGTVGDMYYNSTTNKLREYINGAWRDAVDADSTQTLSNKTLTSPVINTPTGITKSDVGLGNVDNTSDATKNAATATLTNKTLTSPVINSPTGIVKGDVGLGNVDNTSDATKNTAVATLSNKQIAYSTAADATATGSNATISTISTGVVRLTNGSLSSVSGIPNGATGLSLIIQNKTGNSIVINNEEATATAANRIQTGNGSNVSMPNNASFSFVYSATSSRWQLVGGTGSGSGGGGKNYLSAIATSQSTTPNTGNGNFELGSTTGWSLFNTTLTGVIPTGAISAGAASIGTFSASSSNTLGAGYSLVTAAASAWAAGQGFISDAFNIDQEDYAKVLTFKAYYRVDSGPTNLNFSGTSSNTLAIYIYDVTNSAWIQPAGVYGLTQNSGVGYVTGTFQTTSASTQYRIAILGINASTGAVQLTWDDFSVGPQTAPLGAVVTDWVDAGTNIITATTTSPTKGTTNRDKIQWRRVGGNLEGIFEYTQTVAGTAGSGNYLFQLPTGLSIDTSKLVLNAEAAIGSGANGRGDTTIGRGWGSDKGTGTSMFNINVEAYDSTRVRLFAIYTNSAGTTIEGGIGSAYFPFTSANLQISFTISVPIAGWSSNVQMSNDTDTRVVSMSAYKSAGSVTANTKIGSWTAVNKDTHGAFNLSTGDYTAPVAGDYFVNFTAYSTTASMTANVYKNGTLVLEGIRSGTTLSGLGNGIVSCVAGDVLSVAVDASLTLATSTTKTVISIFRLSGPSVIAATESVNASYYVSANVSAGTAQQINFDTKEFDSHNAVTTGSGWLFTAPISGIYALSGYVNVTVAATSGLFIYKNGAIYKNLGDFNTDGETNMATGLFLNAGDTLQIRPGSTYTINGGALSARFTSNIFIKRVGN